MDYIVKDVGRKEKTMSTQEVLAQYGTKVSLGLLTKPFVESVIVMDESGAVKTTITKDDEIDEVD